MPKDAPADPGPSTPDRSDWAWVLERPCPDCGFDSRLVLPPDVPGLVRHACAGFLEVLTRREVARRPAQGVWSPLEYCCHVRELCDVMRGRLVQILAGGGGPVRLADWDQDATSRALFYWRTDPTLVSGQLGDAAEAAAAAFELPSGDQWDWAAERSNGSVFTAATLAAYFVHDLRHHLWDVTA